VREFLLGDARLVATELLTTPSMTAIVAGQGRDVTASAATSR